MIKSRHLAKVIFKMLEDGKDPEEVFSRVESFLKKGHLVSQWKNIVHHLKIIVDQKKREGSILINAAHPLKPGTVSLIRSLIKSGEGVPAEIKINPDLIGGFTAKYAGRVYDGSIKSQLNKLKNMLVGEI